MLPILVSHEESQVVTDALLEQGIDAYSCDLMPTRGKYPERHIQGDVFEVAASRQWGGLIAFPNCTNMTVSSAKHLYKEKKAPGRINWDRMNALADDAIHFREVWKLPIYPKCLENSKMLTLARRIIGVEPTQIIEMWEYGHKEMKGTMLWLDGLPPLVPTDIVGPPPPIDDPARKEWEVCFRMGPSATRARDRAIFKPGVAKAMAKQWKKYLTREGEK